MPHYMDILGKLEAMVSSDSGASFDLVIDLTLECAPHAPRPRVSDACRLSAFVRETQAMVRQQLAELNRGLRVGRKRKRRKAKRRKAAAAPPRQQRTECGTPDKSSGFSTEGSASPMFDKPTMMIHVQADGDSDDSPLRRVWPRANVGQDASQFRIPVLRGHVTGLTLPLSQSPEPASMLTSSRFGRVSLPDPLPILSLASASTTGSATVRLPMLLSGKTVPIAPTAAPALVTTPSTTVRLPMLLSDVRKHDPGKFLLPAELNASTTLRLTLSTTVTWPGAASRAASGMPLQLPIRLHSFQARLMSTIKPAVRPLLPAQGLPGTDEAAARGIIRIRTRPSYVEEASEAGEPPAKLPRLA